MIAKVALAAAAGVAALSIVDLGSPDPGPIPPDYLVYYKEAEPTCPHLTWSLLAGVGFVETNHGKSTLPGVHSGENSAHARGPMQFLPTTFATVRERHADVSDQIYDARTSVLAAAHYLCDSGVADGRVMNALLTYNHSLGYAFDVEDAASFYASAGQ